MPSRDVDKPIRDQRPRCLRKDRLGDCHQLGDARSLATLFGDTLRNARLASISPLRPACCAKLGFEPAVEATEYTMDAWSTLFARRSIRQIHVHKTASACG